MKITRLAAEWEPQSGVMLTWPHDRGDWGDTLAQVEKVFVQIACVLARHERLVISCRTESHLREVHASLRAADAELDAIRLAVCPSDDVWARDHGPIAVERDDGTHLLDFQFNGWGRKFPAALDNRVSQTLSVAGCFGATPMETLPFVLEGGSIDSDGAGTLLTTSRCLLHDKRNPQLARADWERKFSEWFGVTRVLWLDHGELVGDDTDGHIDMLARFAGIETIVYQQCSEADYPARASLDAMLGELRALTTATGKPYRLLPLPWPAAHCDEKGHRLPAGYANFLVVNDAVLVPVYGDTADGPACDVIGEAFPGRRVEPVPCLPLIAQHGSLHCVTMQFPAGVELPGAPIPAAASIT